MEHPFVHTPLDLSRQEIRLIRLLDDDSTTTIRLQIQHFEVGSPSIPEYWALSYTWGPPSPAFSIEMNDHRYTIRENLHTFLLEARRRRLDEWIWIDQLSIAQDDTTERNHQVSMMGSIYLKAERVVVWLGDPGAAEPKLLSEWLSTLPQQILPAPPKGHEPRLTSTADADVMATLDKFCRNRYWNRVWIIQESLLAQRKTIWWGQHSIGTAVKNVLHDETLHSLANPSNGVQMPVYASVYFRLSTTREAWGITRLVMMMSSCACENPRDFVYGIKEVIRHSSLIEVDYRKSVADVFYDAVVLLMQEFDASDASVALASKHFQYVYTILRTGMLCGKGVEAEPVDQSGADIHRYVSCRLHGRAFEAPAQWHLLYTLYVTQYRRIKAWEAGLS